MTSLAWRSAWVCLAVVAICISAASAAEPEVINLWPGKPPGETATLPPEHDTSKPGERLVGGKPVIRLTNVSTPTLTIYRPKPEVDTGAAIVICPGGGHRILAFNHEGTEVAEWLASIGVTGIVLKYRVPARSPDRRYEAAVQDAQRAVSLVRSKADAWKLDPKRIGILGFSAGGETAGLTAILHNERLYSPADEVDQVSCRPDFAVLIYPAYFVTREKPWELQEHIRIDSSTPPMFLAHSFDDGVPVTNSLLLFAELKKAGVTAELHAFASGGHGYGIRDTGHPCNQWPQHCAQWLRGQGWLAKRP